MDMANLVIKSRVAPQARRLIALALCYGEGGRSPPTTAIASISICASGV